ncbi:DUF3885 domain-containing protein [Enterococcus sp. AZ007]|uniref:DUF3885 domain-containing protein n=1 Tax=Enterococcus sp. AZ007 TaxID=2774839 RepID=UPI003F2255AC
MNKNLRTIYSNYHHTYQLKENIRFELAHGKSSNYLDKIVNAKYRAHVLFDEIFKNSPTVQIVLFLSRHSNKTNIKKFLHKNSFKIVDCFMTTSSNYFDDDLVTIFVLEIEKNNLRISKTIDAICYQDFYSYGKLRIKNPFVFYNCQDNLILNIYDDRGCDIWSDNLTKQADIYQKYNSWILDYDRESIAKFYEPIL